MLSKKQPAPPIDAVSLSGRPLDLGEFHGKKVLVKFHRFSGCPVARRQIHDLIEDQHALNAAGIETIVVLHSSQEKMRPNFDEVPGLHLIADPGKALYRAYQAEFLWRRLLSPMSWRETFASFARGYLPPIQQVPGRDHRRPLRLPPRRTLRRLLDGRRRSPSCRCRTRGSRSNRVTARSATRPVLPPQPLRTLAPPRFVAGTSSLLDHGMTQIRDCRAIDSAARTEALSSSVSGRSLVCWGY
jgi:peroxiredoxin